MTVLSVIGAIVLALLGLVAIGATLEFFIFGPRRDRKFAQNYRSTSIDPTGPFWWLPGPSVKRDHPVPAPQAEHRESMRLMQFVLLLTFIAIAAAVISYRSFF